MRILKFSEAILEATDQILREDSRSVVMGLGVTDPKGIFGTVSGLHAKYGPGRVIETPTAESATAGIAIGASLAGLRTIITHQRVEFALLAIEQIVNQAAKWSYMTDGAQSVSVVFRLIIGRGWGQGPQHSQSLESWFAHIPGLTVVAPANAADAKGLLVTAMRSNRPVIYLEHRWLHETTSEVGAGLVEVPLGSARVVKTGSDITIVCYSYAVIDAIKVSEIAATIGVSVEIIDLRTLRPIDFVSILQSVRKTGRLLTIDIGWKNCGIGAEVLAQVMEESFGSLRAAPVRLALQDTPIPSTRALANAVYPGVRKIFETVCGMLSVDSGSAIADIPEVTDIPDRTFTGPF